MRTTTKQLFKRASLLVGAVLVVEMLFFLNVNRASIYDKLVTFDLIPKPEKMTELYFNNNADLPDSATSNQEIHFAFVIHNLETTDYQYVYEVSVIANGMRHIVDRGNVLAKDNQYYVRNEEINLMNAPGRREVVVELINMHQSIDFWVEEGLK